MTRLFVGNFDFEHELADPRGWRASTDVRRMLAERACSWIAMAEDGDLIWTPEPIGDFFWDQMTAAGLPRVLGVADWTAAFQPNYELVPWGWTDRISERHGSGTFRNLTAVRIGNSRRWSFDLEQEFGVALPGAARIERVEEFTAIVGCSASLLGRPVVDQSWVVKANFGMAGRERLLGRGPELSVAQRNWLHRRIQEDGAVFFEPWLPLIEEVGIQWDIPRVGVGPPELVGITPLLTDSQGGYRGSLISLEIAIPAAWQSAVEVTRRVARRLQALGYFGPLGIDSAIADDGNGREILRPLQDINARFTMGRLALGFRRLLRPGETAEWRHDLADAASRLPTELVRRIPTSPTRIENSVARHRSELLISARLDDGGGNRSNSDSN